MNHWVWIFTGLVMLIAEIYVSGYFCLGFGFSAIFAGILFPRQFPDFGWEIVTFIFLGTLLTLLAQQLGKKYIIAVEKHPEIHKLVGRIGLVMEHIVNWRAGVVEIDGKVWEAVSEDKAPLRRLRRVIVQAVRKNQLVVSSSDTSPELSSDMTCTENTTKPAEKEQK